LRHQIDLPWANHVGVRSWSTAKEKSLTVHFSANLHLSREGHDGDTDLGFNAGFEHLVDVSWIACCEGTENNEYLTRGVGWEMAWKRQRGKGMAHQ
jgi:hypothetical protein